MLSRNSLMMLLGAAGIVGGSSLYDEFAYRDYYRVCLDANNLRLPETSCGPRGGGGGGGGYSGRYGYLHYTNNVPAVGQAVTGASAEPQAGHAYATADSGGVSRGGFGASGGGGDGGGE